MNHETATALDPQAKAVIDLIIKSGRPPYHQLSPKDARQMFRDTRPASTPPAPEIGAVKDLTAGGPAGTIPVRLYRPKGVPASTMLPALVVALWALDHGAPSRALQVLVYPVTDVGAESQSYADFAEGFMLTRDSMRWFIAHYLTGKHDAVDWRVSPLRAPSLARVAPALVVLAGLDPLRDPGRASAP